VYTYAQFTKSTRKDMDKEKYFTDCSSQPIYDKQVTLYTELATT